MPIVIGISGKESLTANNVAQVRAAWQRQPARYEAIFDQIDRLALAGVEALGAGDLIELGELMNLNHGLLNALQLSTPELEEMIHVARRAGAVGAKLTGGGGGGSMIALCPNNAEAVAAAIEAAGLPDADVHRRCTGARVTRATRNLVVSSEEERLILVDSDDRETRHVVEVRMPRRRRHSASRLLAVRVQSRRRAVDPSAPSGEAAVARLLVEQLLQPSARRRRRWKSPFTAASNRNSASARNLEYVYKFEYTAPFGDVGTEHELCWVYVGTTDAEPLVNTTEVANWRWIAPVRPG